GCEHSLFARLSARSLPGLLKCPFTFFALGVVISVDYIFVKALYSCLTISEDINVTVDGDVFSNRTNS
ncbi:3287_t:CDS:2, partial [Ambispora leptoticha]